jgi:glutaredoxin
LLKEDRNLKCVVYSTKACPKCEQLKRSLKGLGVDFEILDMATPEALTELRVNGVFTLAAPVLQTDDKFYTVDDLFDGDNIRDLQAVGLKSA